MKELQVSFLFILVLGATLGAEPNPVKSCKDFALNSDFGKVTNATQTGDCIVTCYFRQSFNPNMNNGRYPPPYAGADAGGGGGGAPGKSSDEPSDGYDDVDPAADINDNGGGYVDIVVDIATSGLESCGKNKVCVDGKCTAIKTEFQNDCSTNAGVGAVAVESPKSCQIKCLRVTTDYKSGNPVKQLLTIKIQIPDKSPCGLNLQCNSGYCMSKDIFPKCPVS